MRAGLRPWWRRIAVFREVPEFRCRRISLGACVTEQETAPMGMLPVTTDLASR